MTISDLIKELQKLDQTSAVLVWGYDDDAGPYLEDPRLVPNQGKDEGPNGPFLIIEVTDPLKGKCA